MRVAVLGTGAMGMTHLNAYARLPDATVMAVYSRDAKRAEEVARQFGLSASSDWSQLLRIPDIDAVDICLPSSQHHKVVLAALAAKKHVLCETPFTRQLDEAFDMIRIAHDSNRKLGVALLTPWVSKLAYIRSRIADGSAGELSEGKVWRHSTPYRAEGSHHADALLELATFDFVYLDWVFGMPVELMANGDLSADGTCDSGQAILKYANGASIAVEFSSFLPAGSPYECGLEISCTKSSLSMNFSLPIDGPPCSVLREKMGAERERAVELKDDDPYLKEIEHFVACLKEGTDLGPMDARMALRALVLDKAIRESMANGRTVKPDLM